MSLKLTVERLTHQNFRLRWTNIYYISEHHRMPFLWKSRKKTNSSKVPSNTPPPKKNSNSLVWMRLFKRTLNVRITKTIFFLFKACCLCFEHPWLSHRLAMQEQQSFPPYLCTGSIHTLTCPDQRNTKHKINKGIIAVWIKTVRSYVF